MQMEVADSDADTDSQSSTAGGGGRAELTRLAPYTVITYLNLALNTKKT